MLKGVIYKVTEDRLVFPTDRSTMKLVYRAIEQASRKWTVPVKDWKLALNRFAIEFEARMPVKKVSGIYMKSLTNFDLHMQIHFDVTVSAHDDADVLFIRGGHSLK